MHLVEQKTGGVENNFKSEGPLGFLAKLVGDLNDAADGRKHLMIAACVQQLNHLVLGLQLRVVVQFGDVL